MGFGRFTVQERADSGALRARFSVDTFNVFNHPGNPNSVGGDGFLNCKSSGQDPRTLQVSLRLDW